MNNFDPSHDFTHIQRVVKLAQIIEAREISSGSMIPYNSDVITLASLLHDVGDHKYVLEGENSATMVEDLLLRLKADAALASEVQGIVSHVSYTKEKKDPARVQAFLTKHPELAIVQDADRLESIGAHGIARFFVYHAQKKETFDEAMTSYTERLENLEGMMKTRAGREMAAVRTRRVKEYRSWFEEEAQSGG